MSDPTQQTPNTVTKQFPCGSCGAKLEFSPGAATLKCPYCSHQNQIPQSAEEIVELDFYEYFARATEQGDSQEVQTVKIRGLGELERLVGKDRFNKLAEPYIAKSNPTPAIVPESARGRAVNRDSEVASDFGEEE